MRYKSVEVFKPMNLIDLASGKPLVLSPGRYCLELEHKSTLGIGMRDYYVIEGTTNGAIVRHWVDQEADGKIRLEREADEDDVTLDGILLPIKSANQLTQHQKEKVVCGHLVKGKFICERCTTKHGLVYPDAIAVYPINIIPYSQNCTECQVWIFNIWQKKKGGPLVLFT